MGLFEKLFGSYTSSNKNNTKGFIEGDIFYTISAGQYHLYKLLKNDKANGTFHVLGYKAVETLPTKDNIDSLLVFAYHTPIAASGFENATFFTHTDLSSDDLSGYFYYLQLPGHEDMLVAAADSYYKEACKLTDLKRYQDAIRLYGFAAELVPAFFEALDNRAFCKMDLGLWEEAITDFTHSLQVNPDGFTAVFSIGECYLRLARYADAKSYFERALVIDPRNKHALSFLKKAEAHINS